MTLHEIRLLSIPVDLHRRAAEHSDAVMRELSLIDLSDDRTVPARLRALTERLREEFGAFTTAQASQLQQAAADGLDSIDIVYELPAGVASAAVELGALLDELDEFCRGGGLLSLVTPDDALAYRHWFLGEFVRQVRDGAEPVPWPEHDRTPSGAGPGTEAGDAPAAADGNGTVVIAIEADLDLDQASQLRPVVAAHLDDGASTVVFDLSACDFVDSVGLSLILATRTRCVERGGTVRVESPRPLVRTMLHHAGVLDVLLGNGTTP